MKATIDDKDLTTLIERVVNTTLDKYLQKIPAPAKAVKEDDALLTRCEVAKKLRKNPATISNWIKNGRIKSEKIERNIFIRQSELNKALEAGGNS